MSARSAAGRRDGHHETGRPKDPAGPARGSAAEPRWLSEVRLRAFRRVLWLRHVWSGHHYESEHLLAISHSEVDRVLTPPAEAARRSRRFTGRMSARPPRPRRSPPSPSAPAMRTLRHLVVTLGLSPADVALFTLALAGALNPAIARVFGYLLDVTDAADPTPALAATLFELAGQPPSGPDSALLRWLLAEPVVTGHDAFAYSTGWRADTLLLRALARPGGVAAGFLPAAADWASGTIGRVVDPPPGPIMRPGALEEIIGLVQQLGQRGEAGLPIEIELAGAAGSGRTSLAAQAAARLGSRLVAVDAATLARHADALAAATREARRARLDGSILAWEHADALPTGFWQAIPAAPLTFFTVETPLAGPAEVSGHRSIRRSVRCGPIGRRERLQLWASLSATPPPTAVAEWALRPAEICVAARRRRRRGPRGRRGVPPDADGRHPGTAEPAATPVHLGRPGAVASDYRASARA